MLHAVKRVFVFDRVYSFDVSNSMTWEQSKENLQKKKKDYLFYFYLVKNLNTILGIFL